MNKRPEAVLLSNTDIILSKMGLLTFLAVFLLGLGAGVELWTASYRAFFVWLVFSLVTGALRVGWKYNDFQKRQQELLRSIERSKERLHHKEESKKKRAEQLESLLDSVERMNEERMAEEHGETGSDSMAQPVTSGRD